MSRSIRAMFTAEVRSISHLAWPVVVTQMANVGLGAIDVLMAGRLSAQDLAAVGVGFSIVNPAVYSLMGVLLAINPIVAQLYGAGERTRIGHKFRQGLWHALAMGVLGILWIYNAEPLMVLMGIEAGIRDLTMDYARATTFGLPFLYGFFVLRFFNEGLGRTRPALVAAVAALPLNFFANWVFMYGHFGLPAMGAEGVGYATAVVWFFLALSLGLWVWLRREYAEFDLRRFCLPHWSDQREILAIGVPNGGSIALEISMFAGVSMMAAAIGVTAVASHQIAINVAAFTYMAPLGVGIAMTSRVGQAVGRGSLRDARIVGFAGIGFCALITLALAVMLLTLPHFLAGLYTTEVAVRDLAAQLLILAAFFQLSDGIQVAAIGALRGLKDTRAPMLINVFAYWGVGIPSCWLFGTYWEKGVAGFWMGLIVGLTVAAILHNLRFWFLIQRRLRMAEAT